MCSFSDSQVSATPVTDLILDASPLELDVLMAVFGFDAIVAAITEEAIEALLG